MTSPQRPQQVEPPPEGDSDYESDHLDAPLRRRAAASDDEGSATEASGNKNAAVHEDLDGEGAAEVYEEEYADGDVDEEEDYDEDYYGEENDYIEEPVVKVRGEENRGVAKEVIEGEAAVKAEASDDVAGERDGNGEEEGKKVAEPYAVPTSGAFYMHDDRCNENGRGRGQRRMFGGRKLWNPRDERAWVHDRYDEMNYRESHYNEGRIRPRGRFRGRGGGSRSRGVGRGYYGSSRPRGYYDDSRKPISDDRNQIPIRGRGTRRYQPRLKNVSETSSTQINKSIKTPETSTANGVKNSPQTSNIQSETKKQINSNLNYASPPFYPSGSSHQEFSVVRDPLAVTSRVQNSSVMPLPGPCAGEKTFVSSAGQDGLYIDDSVRTVPVRSLSSSAITSSGFTQCNRTGEPSVPRNHNRGPTVQEQQLSKASHQVGRVSTNPQCPSIHQRTVQTTDRSAQRIANQMFGLQIGGYTPMPSLHPPAVSLAEDRQGDISPDSNKSKTQLSDNRRNNSQVTEMGSFPYGGTLGNSRGMGLAFGDTSFPGTAALLPVMQFSAQNPGGTGVQAVGMALPGYVAPQQLGLGNSEMTWLPVLAGSAGALRSAYPYIALDNSFYPRASTPSPAAPRETNTSKASSSLKSQQLPAEIMNDDMGQRQNKPRRYSEMNFGQ